jgi:ADP-ribosylation factor-like protein 2
MGLLTILKKVKQKEKELRILILGLDNAGYGPRVCTTLLLFHLFTPQSPFSYRKTTIMKRVLGEDHHEICPTVGFNIKTLEYNGLNLNLWDVGGQKSIRTYWRNYFEQTDGIIWVVDSVDRWRLEECKAHLKDLLTQEVS